MRLLFDENTSYRVIKKLQIEFPEAIHVSTVKLMASKDINIFEYARQNNYHIVTYDEDYHALSVLRGAPPKVIWIRTGNLPTTLLAELLISRKSEIVYFLSDAWEEDYSCLQLFL
jgi:predicted nuclease of predicted toxin-antitoxin system